MYLTTETTEMETPPMTQPLWRLRQTHLWRLPKKVDNGNGTLGVGDTVNYLITIENKGNKPNCPFR